ncbi:MAG TPA: hypothetical protein VGD45_05750 [Steroidobacter sp.]|uniref:hypothetical protein n=1 Tax=Steroidobacter sp. TaxID=1978227 RepID=UPI002EDB34F7
MRGRFVLGSLMAVCLASSGLSQSAAAASAGIRCTMKFTMQGWSAFYKTADGNGTIQCSNGQSMKVKLSAKGGGLTVGKSSIENGRGKFSAVASPDELLGTYVAAEAHAGAVKSSGAQVMTKGEVSLALSGTGRGFDLGVALGAMTISR